MALLPHGTLTLLDDGALAGGDRSPLRDLACALALDRGALLGRPCLPAFGRRLALARRLPALDRRLALAALLDGLLPGLPALDGGLALPRRLALLGASIVPGAPLGGLSGPDPGLRPGTLRVRAGAYR